MTSDTIASDNGHASFGETAREIALIVLFGIGFGALAMLTIELTRGDARIAAIWFPNAVAVAVLFRMRIRHEALLFASMFTCNSIANFLVGDSAIVAFGLAGANAIEIATIMIVGRRLFGRTPDMLDTRQLLQFIGVAAIVAPMISGIVGMAALSSVAAVTLLDWLHWAGTDGLGNTIIAPAIMILVDGWRNRHRPTRAEVVEWVAMLVGGTAITIGVFAQEDYPLLFLAAPVVISHAFRLGAAATAFSVLKVAVVAITFTALGTGPINLIDGPLWSKLIVLQLFLASAFLIGLPVAANLAGRRRILGELSRGKRQLDLLTGNLTDAILRYDNDGICTYASPSTRAVLGRDPSDFMGRHASAKAHSSAREEIEAVEKALIDRTIDKQRFTYRRLLDDTEGKPVYIEADCAVIVDPVTGTNDGFVVSARDMTERVELEALLKRARVHAEQAARAKSEFLANMSHEIRTPMNGVLGFAELLMESDLAPDQRRHARMIVESGRSMMLLLNDILDLSKIEAGQIAIHTEQVDVQACVRDCAAQHRPGAERKGLDLEIEFLDAGLSGAPARKGPFVLTDGLRLRQILLNLIGNAVKFTEEGGVTVRCTIGAKELTVEIRDTGIGIGGARLETIFNPFTQAESNTSRRYGGTGLGLSISRNLAHLLGGTIRVESTPGAGSNFIVKIPAKRVKADPLGPVRSDVDAAPNSDWSDIQAARILLAEDHDINRVLVCEMLERCGQDVGIAHDGNEAISMVIDAEMRGKPFDLVLMDVQMPGCDGYTATRAIRGEGITANDLPIIALTANAFAEDITAAREAGMQAHLAKPLAFADLAKVLQRWLPTRIVEQEFDGPEGHSPEMLTLWEQRKTEALEAVRSMLEDGDADERGPVAQLLHKVAGTAAMFDEAELGDRARALEVAIKDGESEDNVEALAREYTGVDPLREPPHASLEKSET